ncbi:MAG: hypothetical protein K9K38_10300 [Rhodoferax sp.]|nr:hypothetical protein [Rhodoferax sp.]MCF8209780.1 hypothetical protein [Rhodoferax sp.]
MKYAVLVLEQPWWDLDEDPGQTSVRHFLDGLSRLDGLPTFYATFYDTNSFGQALKYLVGARKLEFVDHLIVYVASHGAGSRIGNGSAPTMNLGTVFDRIKQYGKGKVVGVMLDSCEVGAQLATIETGMKKTKIRWLMGYGASVDWLTSTLINLHVLSVMTSLDTDELKSRDALTAAVQEALGLFNPYLTIDADEDDEDAPPDDEAPLVLSELLTLAIQPSHANPSVLSPKDIWPELELEGD